MNKLWFFFSLRIRLDWKALVQLRSPNFKKQRGFFSSWKKYFTQIKDFLKKSDLLRFFLFIDHFERKKWMFWVFYGFSDYLGFFWLFEFLFDFFLIFFNFELFLIFLNSWIFLGRGGIFFGFYEFFSKLLRLLLKITKVTTGHKTA